MTLDPRRIAAHRLAQIARQAGVPVPEERPPAGLPPLAPGDPRPHADLAMLVLEARRSPGRRGEIVGGIVDWIASTLPPWEAERAARAHLQPRPPPPGLRGLLQASIAHARNPTLHTAATLAFTVAREAARPCTPAPREPGGASRARAAAAAAVIATSIVTAYTLDPLTSIMVTLAVAALAALYTAAHAKTWARIEAAWTSCRATRLDVHAAIAQLLPPI